MSLADRHALVTGASRGIGFAIASALVDAGAKVTLLGRTEQTLRLAVEELGSNARYAVADVTDEAALTQAIAGAGQIDILVNNAGGTESMPFKKMRAADLRSTLDFSLMPVFTAIQAVLPGMVERGWGRIVNVASTAGLKGYAYVAHYCAAKHAVIGLTRALATEVARSGVTVNAICPGYTDTDWLRSTLANIQAKTGMTEEEALSRILAANPQGRAIRTEEVASCAAWLCLPESAAVTGQSISISGGEVT